jgi:pyridoxal phosphate enzyme (YggS family)
MSTDRLPEGDVDMAAVAERVAKVRERIARAAVARGRDPDAVTLVAVTKLQPPAAVEAARAAGVADIGENYPQELAAKAAATGGGLRWHLIGRLQRNKAGIAVANGALVHTLDSVELAKALGRRALDAGTVAEALVQVETEDRPAAHGIPLGGLDAFVDRCLQIGGLRLRGLMTMPAYDPDPERSRPAFARLAEVVKKLGPDMRNLSMGMSNDLEVAVEEGATLVRIGTAIFGPRPPRPRAV